MMKLIKFYSDGCAPCRAMASIVDSATYERGIELDTQNVGTAEGINLARSMGIRQVPTFVLMKDGEAIGIRSGAMPEEDFIKFLEETE